MGQLRQLWLEHDPGLALATAARTLHAGGVVLFPTDTVYGLLAWAPSSQGYSAILRLKGRSADKPLQLLALPDSAVAQQGLDALAAYPDLARQFRAGALTLVAAPGVYPGVPPEVLQLQPGAVGIRAPRLPAVLDLLRALALPQLIWGTSANAPGAAPCCTAAEACAWLDSLEAAPELAVLSRTPCHGAASSVVRLAGGPPERLR